MVRVMRSGKNPPIKFTKLFREPLLQALFALRVAEFSVLPVISESDKQSATHLMGGKADQAAGLFASFVTFLSNKEKLDISLLFQKDFFKIPLAPTDQRKSPAPSPSRPKA